MNNDSASIVGMNATRPSDDLKASLYSCLWMTMITTANGTRIQVSHWRLRRATARFCGRHRKCASPSPRAWQISVISWSTNRRKAQLVRAKPAACAISTSPVLSEVISSRPAAYMARGQIAARARVHAAASTVRPKVSVVARERSSAVLRILHCNRRRVARSATTIISAMTGGTQRNPVSERIPANTGPHASALNIHLTASTRLARSDHCSRCELRIQRIRSSMYDAISRVAVTSASSVELSFSRLSK